MQENKTILALIKLKYRDNPEELELWLLAWDAHPTLKKDCYSKQLEKDYLRHKFVKELKVSKANFHS
jgi:hypothetical protein